MDTRSLNNHAANENQTILRCSIAIGLIVTFLTILNDYSASIPWFSIFKYTVCLVICLVIIAAIVVLTFAALITYKLQLVFQTHRSSANNANNRGIGFANFIRTMQGVLSGISLLQRTFGRSQGNQQQQPTQNKWYNVLFGDVLEAKNTVVKWDSSFVVGNQATLVLRFKKKNKLAYNLLDQTRLEATINVGTTLLETIIQKDNECKDRAFVRFTPIISGKYEVQITINSESISREPINADFLPGDVDPSKSCLAIPSSLFILQEYVPEMFHLDERDKYGNRCVSPFENLWNYEFVVRKINGQQATPKLSFSNNTLDNPQQNQGLLQIDESGVFSMEVLYQGVKMGGEISIIVLNSKEMSEVTKNVNTLSWNLYYECHMSGESEKRVLSQSDSLTNKSRRISTVSIDQITNTTTDIERKQKKVYAYISTRYITIKEFYLKIIPRTLFTFRITPSLNVKLFNRSYYGSHAFYIQNTDNRLLLFSKHRNIVVATLAKLLLKNIGGSESFEDKRMFFQKEIRKLASSKSTSTYRMTIRRDELLKNSFREFKLMSTSDWWKKFDICFSGEMGMDYGGLTREWVHLLVQKLFHDDHSLFKRFDEDDPQALKHPNPNRSAKYQKLRYYEFAGTLVAKCLIDSAYDSKRQQYVNAKLTRSFYSQILGLGVNWKHFATDDKLYYSGKIKYILENDPVYLDIYFTEDLYDSNNKFIKMVDLKPNGSKIQVTNENKLEYIQRLAEFKLSENVRDEINSFLKGLYNLIPEGLLSIFTVNELELLICGMGKICVQDLKRNCVVACESSSFNKVMTWFWTIASSFNQEELSRLVQFSTGSSQLPPEGFSGLNPKFQISPGLTGLDSLPSAHTCFNTLCLPDYSDMITLREKLMIALSEGNEGFGLS